LRRRILQSVWLAAACGAATVGLHGIIFYDTAESTHNTTAPSGTYANSGWQWQGNWRGFTGTPIGTNWFLTAQHLGGQVGEEFLLEGVRYRTTAFFDDPATDLRLWRVCRPFTSFAPMYNGPGETGRVCVLFGRGLGRGAEVTITNAGTVEVRGWYWGGGGGTLRWGLNRIAGYEDMGEHAGVLLWGTFDAGGGADEAMLTGGDSGGGLFIRQREGWQLAGIAYAVEGPFNHVAEDPGFSAALFDRRGLYEQDDNGWAPVPDAASPLPASFYVSRVGARRGWVEETMAANPEPPAVPVLLAAPTPQGPFVAVAADVDPQEREIRLAAPAGSTYFQLSACRPLRITRVGLDGATLVLDYE